MLVSPAGFVTTLRDEVLGAVPRALDAWAARLEAEVPRVGPAVAWLRANRRDVAAVASVVGGVLLFAAGAGLL